MYIQFTLFYFKNKTNLPISSNSHPSATANKAIHDLKIEGGGLQKQQVWAADRVKNTFWQNKRLYSLNILKLKNER